MLNSTENFLQLVENFLMLLTQKEREVVIRRFNLDNKEKATLEEIGQKFTVTRERIRQIEKNALGKLRRNLENTALKDVSTMAQELLEQAGGVIREDSILNMLKTRRDEFKYESLQLILTIDKNFSRIPNTVSYFPYIKANRIDENDVMEFNKKAIQILKKKKEVQDINELVTGVNENKEIIKDLTLAKSVLSINKSIKFLTDTQVGLTEWRHINPRTLRDKVFFVLRKEGKPMHFVEIANTIINEEFDRKKVNLQAVHNELIRHSDFILIGRGIYGLGEWGYTSGTVADVISSILKGKESMSQEEIVKEVLKQRQVKPITVVLSLKNKKQFVRIGRKQYALA